MRFVVGKRDTRNIRPEDAKWEFVRLLEGLIAVKSRTFQESPETSDRLVSFMDVTGEASTPEEWAVAFVEKLARLVLEMRALQEVVGKAREACRGEMMILERKHAEEMSRCRDSLRKEEERYERLSEELVKAGEAEREVRRKLIQCEEEKNDLWDKTVGQSLVIARQQDRLNRCGC